MLLDAKTERSLVPDVGSSTEWESWGAEAEELPEPLGAEVPEDISNNFRRKP